MQDAKPIGTLARPSAVCCAVALALFVVPHLVGPASAQVSGGTGAQRTVGGSGLPLPRFVSLKVQPVNLRRGPGTRYPIDWVLRRAGMPLEIVQEYEVWRQVRDAEGTTGWVHGAFLSGRRTGAVRPWALKEAGERPVVSLYRARSASSAAVARIEAGATVDIAGCDGRWCRVSVGDFSGHMQQRDLWGVYPGETVD